MTLSRLLLGAAIAAGPLLTAVPAAWAETPVYGGPTYGPAAAAPCTRRTEVFARGKAINLDFSTDVRQASVTDPLTADVQMGSSSRRFSILGLAVGQTDATFYDGAGRCILTVDIRVGQDVSGAVDIIRKHLPDARVELQAAGPSIIVSGLVQNAAEADKVVQIARQFVTRPDQVLNMLAIAERDQVQLNVRVVEVNRTAIKQLGFDLNAIIGDAADGQLLFSNSANFAVNGGQLGGVSAGASIDTISRPGESLKRATGVIQAFERAGLMRVLSEPNLSTVSGEGAKFLAGGEYPVPSGRDQTGNIMIEFKQYGVGLGFTPTVLSGGRISMKMSVEVSDLTTTGALTLTGVVGGASSAVIPALSVRRVENTVELPSGGSMMIAGLLQDSTRQNIDKVPGVADVPVFGALARSRDFLRNETELVIIATPFLIKSVAPATLQTPADGLKIASDTETNLLGQLNRAYAAPSAAPAPRSYQGPIGHVIE